MAKNKYYQVGSVMKPFTKTKQGEPIPKEEQGNGTIVLSGDGARELGRQLMKLKDDGKVILYMNTIDEQIERVQNATSLSPERIEQKVAGLSKRKDFVRFDLTLSVKNED